MAADEVRTRYLRDRVLTASPAQRVVMLYDRLGLDLTLAQAALTDGSNAPDAVPDAAPDVVAAGAHLGHALQVVAELQASLDSSAGGPAANLASLYAFLVGEIIAIRGGAAERLPAVAEIVGTLRDAWAQAAQSLSSEARSVSAAAGAWVG